MSDSYKLHSACRSQESLKIKDCSHRDNIESPTKEISILVAQCRVHLVTEPQKPYSEQHGALVGQGDLALQACAATLRLKYKHKRTADRENMDMSQGNQGTKLSAAVHHKIRVALHQ